MFGCLVCLDDPYVWMYLTVCLDAPICLDAPCMFGYPLYVWMPHVCLDDVWMPAVHIQHKESMLCQSKGVSICPHTFVCPICLDAPCMLGSPICLDTTYMFGCTPCMFGHPNMFGCFPVCLDATICLDVPTVCLGIPYVWMPPWICCGHSHVFGCLLYIYNSKKAFFVRLMGCHICTPHIWMPPYVWMPPVCLDTLHMFGCPSYLWMPTYIQLASKHTGGHPNIRQCPYMMGASKHTGGHSNIGGIANMDRVHPNTWWHLNIQGHPNIQGVSKDMGACKHTGGHSNIWGHSNIQGVHPNTWWHLNIQGASKHTGGIQTYGGIQMYGGHMDTPLVWQSMLSLCCVCTGGMHHPNIWGSWSIQGASKHPGASKHTGVHPNIQGGIWRHPNIQGHPNVWGHMDTPLVWQSMLSLCCVCTRGIQTYGGTTYFLHYLELYPPSWISTILFFYFKYFTIFQNIPVSFAFCVDRNSLLHGVRYIVLYFLFLLKIWWQSDFKYIGVDDFSFIEFLTSWYLFF